MHVIPRKAQNSLGTLKDWLERNDRIIMVITATLLGSVFLFNGLAYLGVITSYSIHYTKLYEIASDGIPYGDLHHVPHGFAGVGEFALDMGLEGVLHHLVGEGARERGEGDEDRHARDQDFVADGDVAQARADSHWATPKRRVLTGPAPPARR